MRTTAPEHRAEQMEIVVSDKLKFFSQEWCDAALEVVNANQAM
jgi:hypothetical protein